MPSTSESAHEATPTLYASTSERVAAEYRAVSRMSLPLCARCRELEEENRSLVQQFVRTDWRRCPECGHEWPHPAETSVMRCPSCRLAKVEAERECLRRQNADAAALRQAFARVAAATELWKTKPMQVWEDLYLAVANTEAGLAVLQELAQLREQNERLQQRLTALLAPAAQG